MRKKIHKKTSLTNRIENFNDNLGWGVLGLYIASLAVISFFHEPWFDEAQSWLIARDMQIKDIIFYMPHYEGHPPLWHLYLVPFAKSGMPYELGIKLAAIIINIIAVWLIIFKAPFKKVIRYTIPFTYYFFYLYGVVSRCYSLTMLGFVLLAMTYKERNTKPYRFVLSMMLICASTAYGILFCAGIAIIWLFEIVKEGKLKGFIPRFIKDKRFTALLLLLVFTLALIYLIMPKADTYAVNLEYYKNSFVQRLFYMIILAPLEATFFTGVSGNYILMYCEIEPNVIVTGIILFTILFLTLLTIGKAYKKISLLIIPYLLFAVFSSKVYFSSHHISLVAYFLLFWFWVCFDSGINFSLPGKIRDKLSEIDGIRAKKLLWLFWSAIIMFGLYWNISASIMEIQVNYYPAREISNFIMDNNLQDKLIMVEWEKEEKGQYKKHANINHQMTPSILAYFNENIVYNFNNGDDKTSYSTHIIPTEDETQLAYNTWRQMGAPDLLIGHPDLNSVFNGEVTLDDYTLVKIINNKRISKDDYGKLGSLTRIYMRNDLVEFYGMDEVDEQYWLNVILGKEKLK